VPKLPTVSPSAKLLSGLVPKKTPDVPDIPVVDDVPNWDAIEEVFTEPPPPEVPPAEYVWDGAEFVLQPVQPDDIDEYFNSKTFGATGGKDEGPLVPTEPAPDPWAGLEPDFTSLAWPKVSVSFGASPPAVEVSSVPRWGGLADTDAPAAFMPDGESLFGKLNRLNELKRFPRHSELRGSAARETAVLEDRLAKEIADGVVSQDYLDYLKFMGVDQRTIDDVASGALPMDWGSRSARATQMGLDPNAVWYRWDHPLKNEMVGFSGAGLSKRQKAKYSRSALGYDTPLQPSQEGLVYTHWHPRMGLRGVQMPNSHVVQYPLLGPDAGIAGVDAIPENANKRFSDELQSRLRQGGWGEEEARNKAMNMPMASPIAETREDSLAALTSRDAFDPSIRTGDKPHFSIAESRKVYTEPLMASGATGSLVNDETGVATAFTPKGSRMLRRADLAPLDPRFKMSRNILQGLLAPIAVGVGASQEDR
jgi:hypothetical protein